MPFLQQKFEMKIYAKQPKNINTLIKFYFSTKFISVWTVLYSKCNVTICFVLSLEIQQEIHFEQSPSKYIYDFANHFLYVLQKKPINEFFLVLYGF